LICIQTIAGKIVFWGDTFVLTAYFGVGLVSVMVGRSAGFSHKIYDQLAYTLLIGAFISAIIALAQVFELWQSTGLINRMPGLRRPGANMGQPNHLATLLLMGLASLIYLYEAGKLGKLSTLLIAATLLLGVAMTESRTGVLSLLVMALWWFAKRQAFDWRLSPWVVSLTVLGFLGLFWYWPTLLNVINQTGGGASAEVNTAVGTRWVVWPQLVQAVLLRPWFGWGLGQVSAAHNAVVDAYPVSEPFTYAHNIVLDLAIGIGIPLTLLLVGATFVWLWRRMRVVQHIEGWYCLAVLAPFAVHSMLEFPFAYAYFLVPAMLAVGALDGMYGGKPTLRLGVKPVAAFLVVATLGFAWSVVEYVRIEEDFRVVRFEALRVGKTPDDYERPRIYLLTQLDALLHGGRIVPKPEMNTDELELARKVALRFPWPATQNRYAQSLALNGNPTEALRQMRVMRALHGEKSYAQVKESWATLASEKYPQLKELTLP